MEKIRKSILIDAPPGNVFEYLSDARHLPEISPRFAISNIVATPDGATSFDWTYRLAGMRFRGHSETVEVMKGRYEVVTNESGVPGRFRWAVAPSGSRTEAQLEIDDYQLPIPVLGRLTTPFLRRLYEHEADRLLTNMKARVEAS